MGYKHHGVYTGGLPVKYIQYFLNVHDIPTFIETGTAGGESVREAAKLFKECHTIEVVEGRADGEYPQNVKTYTGDSAQLLREIAAPYKNQNVFFWLDAHYSEPDEAKPGTIECPVIEEIKALHGFTKALVMIDDARLFLGPPKWPCNYTVWPSFSTVFNALQASFPDHQITVIDDYIVACPPKMKDELRTEWWSNQDVRFPSDESKLKQAVRLAYTELLNYIK